ncbi:MAG: hypothetical protein IKO06_05235, partial [Alphaproteobacteria bacterium]|nr:hypothetical protein [Alphaproteobacteria bacterium]
MDLHKNKFFGYLLSPNMILFILAISFYISYSVIVIQQRIPFFDEVNAWNISQNCSLSELFQITRHEGHFMLWYLLLKPFSVPNLFFPTSMFVINWIFAFSAVLLLWWKAPFNPWLKTFITFSLPLQMFTLYARCYALGTLVLFIICTIYPKRKKHPILYPLLIILLGNISIMACIGAFVFGLLYCYDLLMDFRAKRITLKDFKVPFIIFSLGGIFILSQMVCFEIPYYSTDYKKLFNSFADFFKLTDYWPRNFVIVIQSVMLLTGFTFFKKSKKPYFFLMATSFLIIFIALAVYMLAPWHYLHLFIFFVVAMWLYLQQNKPESLVQKIYYGIFFLLSFLWIFYFKIPWAWDGFYPPTVEYLQENMDEYKGAKIFMYPADPSNIGAVAVLRDADIEFYSSHGYSYKSYKSYLYQWNVVRIDFINIKKEILADPQKEDKAYLFVSTIEKHRDNLQSVVKLYRL